MNSFGSFEALPLAAPLQRALRDKNYSTPSEIQAAAIPVLLEGRDLLGAAQTGTGKTAAFALPILQKIHDNPEKLRRNSMRALILTPTRELAVQVAKSFSDYGRHMKIVVETVYGGVSMSRQIQAMNRGVDILVATPGRLLDLTNQGQINFGHVESFVLDEADRMLDMGFINDIRKVLGALPEKRQSLFFSATISHEIVDLAQEILSDPVEIRLTPKVTTAEKIDHKICFVQQDNKIPLLESLIQEQMDKPGRNLTLVFTRTKFRADKIARAISRDGLNTEAIHGNKSQAARQRALDNFRKGRAPVLVATDVAARGIDVKDVSLVVNFDMPDEPEAYVHRIGRTARGGAEGNAITFCSEDNIKELQAIERLIKTEIPIFSDHPFHLEKLTRFRTTHARSGNGSNRGGRSGGGNRGYASRSNSEGASRPYAPRSNSEGASRPHSPRSNSEGASRPHSPRSNSEGASRPYAPRSNSEGASRPHSPRSNSEGASRPYSPRSNAEGGAPRRNKSDDKRPEFSASAADSRESFRPPAHNQDASGPMRKKVSRKPSRKRAGEVRQNGQPAMR